MSDAEKVAWLRASIRAIRDERYAGDFTPILPKLTALLEEVPE